MIINIKHYSKDTRKITHYLSEFRQCKDSDFKSRGIELVEDYTVRFCPKLEDLVDTWYISNSASFNIDY